MLVMNDNTDGDYEMWIEGDDNDVENYFDELFVLMLLSAEHDIT